MKFRLGINYWPVSSAMYWWQHFDAEEVERDFARIQSAGFDVVRIFLLWEDFQPAPDRVSSESLVRLVKVADVASRHDLGLVPTLFTGHMSGVNWIPKFALAPRTSPPRFRVVAGGRAVEADIKNWYADVTVIRAQALLAREAASALQAHPALWGWDLGNENSNCAVPPSREAGVAWLERMAGEIKSIDPSTQITLGLHMEDLEEDRRLGPREAARVCDFLCMHGYSIYANWARNLTDAWVLPFLGLITHWLGHRDVLFEEFGAPTLPRNDPQSRVEPSTQALLLGEEAAASFTRQALSALHQFGFLGAMVWCFGDYAKSLWARPPLDETVHERYFGLWRSDHTAKPALAEIRGMAGVERHNLPEDSTWIDVSADDYWLRPRENLVRLYRNFRERYCTPGQ
jgi:endo-1,4-beta-mannosidase